MIVSCELWQIWVSLGPLSYNPKQSHSVLKVAISSPGHEQAVGRRPLIVSRSYRKYWAPRLWVLCFWWWLDVEGDNSRWIMTLDQLRGLWYLFLPENSQSKWLAICINYSCTVSRGSALQMSLQAQQHIYKGAFDLNNLPLPWIDILYFRSLLADNPDIVIATPSRALGLLQSKVNTSNQNLFFPSNNHPKTLSLPSLESLVIDEADLILSYGHDEDIRNIFSGSFLPKVYQSFLMSATMTEDVEMLKGLALRNPVCLNFRYSNFIRIDSMCGRRYSNLRRMKTKLPSSANIPSGMSPSPLNLSNHLFWHRPSCSEVDKFLLTYVILKLRLIKGKCILFVNDVDRSYRLKLFLEQFSIKSCVLNSELPLNSRWECGNWGRWIGWDIDQRLIGIIRSRNLIRGFMIILLRRMRVGLVGIRMKLKW